MQLKVLNQTFEIINNEDVIESIFSHINNTIQSSSFYLSHFKIDGIEIFDSYEDYIMEHKNDISVIEVKVKTIEQFLHDILITAQEYLERAIPEIRVLSDEFYQGTTNESWGKFNQFLEGLQWIFEVINSIESIHRNKESLQKWEQYVVISFKLKEGVQQLEQAMQHSDFVLVGDILRYEMVTLLEELYSEINKTIDNEVVKDDIN